MAGGSVGTGSGPIADINVTPLIDVVLVLLVVFMVITPLLASGLQVDLPVATSTVTVNDVGQHVTISLTEDGKLSVEQEILTTIDDLVGEVNAAFRENPERSILVKADAQIEYSRIREVLDVLAENGMTSIFVAAGKEK